MHALAPRCASALRTQQLGASSSSDVHPLGVSPHKRTSRRRLAGAGGRPCVVRATLQQGEDGAASSSQPSSQVEIPPQPLYKLAVGLAGAGALENAYLTFNKLAGIKPALCSAGGGCEATLSGVYSELFGLPLSLFGAAAYAAVGLVAASALAAANDPDPLVRLERPNQLKWVFLGGATVLVSVSGYLMTVLATKIGQPCPYCLTSAALSTGILLSAAPGFRPAEVQKQGTALAAVALSAVTLLALPQMRAADRAQAVDIPYKEPVARARGPTTLLDFSPTPFPHLPSLSAQIMELADDRAKALALYLEQAGAKMYGAFWCSHCLEQKELFGAGAKVPYVECYPDGYRTGVKINPACDAAKVEGFPTWVINGERIEGAQPLEKLAELSGFPG